MMFLVCVSFLLLVFYVLLISIYHYGWRLIRPFNPPGEAGSYHSFSIIVPARNEEANIRQCLLSILAQQYPQHLFELIVIDDQSDDRTSAIVKEVISEHPGRSISLIGLEQDEQFVSQKKAAITRAVAQAANEFIVLTDADCTTGVRWLSTINAFTVATPSKMIYAPVEYKAGNVFEKMQLLEFAALVAIGGAAIRLRNPNMCSAANLIFEKQLFDEIGGYEGNEDIASGDDEFLLHKAFKLYPDRIHFLKSRDAIVKTTANGSLRELTDQRRRWVSKSTKYENRYITAILTGAYLFNLAIVVNLFLDFRTGLLLLAVKTLCEGLFLYNVMSFFRKRAYLLFLPLAEIFHIIYVLVIGIWANIRPFQWKGREVR